MVSDSCLVMSETSNDSREIVMIAVVNLLTNRS